MAQRNLVFTPESWRDYTYWLGQDKKTLKKINKLIADVARNPFEGVGKPEPLKENYAGLWSRRIDEKNRLIYAINDSEISIIGCRFHY
ncbi:MAG TPA: Txe/YoeB family addiction module toxin [Candidatus Saccharimonadia bacterium]|nr:Txe/YoeB family addiction module toxin [Candidatus Saccharimonadia bacterium]